jgi:uncharacterized protein (DUF1015 family)
VVAIAPFVGLLFDRATVGEDLAAVTSPPYDVVLPHDQARLHESSPYNIARVDLGAEDAGEPEDKYTRAGRLLRRWRRDGVLVPTGRPSVYPYEMRFGYQDEERRVRGVLVEVGLEPWGGAILPHERTLSAPVEDRLRLMRATAADLSPIYAVVGGPSAAQRDLLERAASRPPERQLTDEEGVIHRLWAEPLPEALGDWYRDRSLLIADGHHRYQTALAHREELRASRGPGPWDAVLMLVVDADAEDPPVLPIHRLLRVDPVPDLAGERVRGLEEVMARLVDDDLRFGAAVRADGGLLHLVGRLEGPPPTVAALHRQLLDPMPGARDVRFVPDAFGAEAAVRSGQADLALFLPPARVANVRSVVASGGRLPEKSTYFWPKPRTGLVIRPLDPPPGAVGQTP